MKMLMSQLYERERQRQLELLSLVEVPERLTALLELLSVKHRAK